MKNTIDALRAAGYVIHLDGETVVWHWRGVGVPDEAHVRPKIEALKKGRSRVIETLKIEKVEDVQEEFEERSAILEYEAGLTRTEAERQAGHLLKRVSFADSRSPTAEEQSRQDA